MARERKEKDKPITLRQPDRSAPRQQTLIDMAQERNLFEQAERRQRELQGKSPAHEHDHADDDDDVEIPPEADRFLDLLLHTTTMAIVHFTFDVLVQNQYGTTIEWSTVVVRTVKAWCLFALLFYPLHPHKANPDLIPGIARKYQHDIRQAIFLLMSIATGCYLINITNNYGYLAVMKRSPPLGCLWLWAVYELDLVWATGSLAVAGCYALWNGYGIMSGP